MNNIEIKKYSKNDYIETYTGKSFKVMFPQLEDICIEDIAHSLAMQCRYSGHSKYFYSIAEHCVHVADMCEGNNFWGLMHDASEAYLTDIPAPIKPFLTNYKELEKDVMNTVCLKFDMSLDEPDIVHYADMQLLRAEARILMPSKGENWTIADKMRDVPIPEIDIRCWGPEVAEYKFLEKFNELYGVENV